MQDRYDDEEDGDQKAEEENHSLDHHGCRGKQGKNTMGLPLEYETHNSATKQTICNIESQSTKHIQCVPMAMWAAVKLVYPIQQTSAGREALILLWQL